MSTTKTGLWQTGGFDVAFAIFSSNDFFLSKNHRLLAYFCHFCAFSLVCMSSMSWQRFSFLGWMSLGALAAALGFAVVLQQARIERQGLEIRVAQLEQTVVRNEDEKAHLASQANERVEEAARALSHAQQTVEQIRHDQQLLAEALPLTRPTGRAYATWVDAFSLPLGVSLRLPPGTKTYADERGLIAMRANQATSTLPWLSISPYDANQTSLLQSSIHDSESVSYLVAGNLVTGVRGKRDGQAGGYTYVLQVVSPQSGQASHLIWAQTQSDITEARIQDTLASLALRS